jgi:hypothetical protein
MATKNVYQEYNQDALNHFKLDEEPLYGVLSSDYEISDVLITQDETKYENIKNILSDENVKSTGLANYKKAFILPRCPITQDRLKSVAKEKGLTITNDYEIADVIITHDDFTMKFTHGEKIQSTVMMYRLWNYEAFTGGHKMIDDYDKAVIYDDKFEGKVRSYMCTGDITLIDEWAIPALALNIAFLIDTGKLKVIDVETLLHASANVIDLTNDLLVEISQWVNSYDEQNIAIAAKILPTINYTKKPHLMWQLAQNINGYIYKFGRDKDVQFWLDQSRFNNLYGNSAQEMILELEVENKLDRESFKYLEKYVRRNISIYNRDLYTFKVSLKPEYKKYIE